jgi:ribonuclease J
VLRAIEEIGADARTDTAEMQTAIRRVVRRFFNKRIERKPMIVPVLLEL